MTASFDPIFESALGAPVKEPLAEHLETIAILRGKRHSWRDIAEFLTTKGVPVDHTKVYRFARAHERELRRLSTDGLNMSSSNRPMVPAAEEYARALRSMSLTTTQKKMLEAHYNAHNRSITFTELANAAGFDSHIVANRHYGQLGRDLGERISFPFLRSKSRKGAIFYSSSIGADNPYVTDEEQYELVMHHELAKALCSLGWFEMPAETRRTK
jgi:hypothetical protein